MLTLVSNEEEEEEEEEEETGAGFTKPLRLTKAGRSD